MGKVKNLAAHTNDSSQWNVRQCLEEALEDLKSGELDAEKCVLVFATDDIDGRFEWGRYTANLLTAETIVLLEGVKRELLAEMGF